MLCTRRTELEIPTIVGVLLLALEARAEEDWVFGGGDVEDSPGLTVKEDD